MNYNFEKNVQIYCNLKINLEYLIQRLLICLINLIIDFNLKKMQNKEQQNNQTNIGLQKIDSNKVEPIKFFTEQKLYQKYTNYTKKQINQLIHQTFILWNYLQKFTNHLIFQILGSLICIGFIIIYFISNKMDSQIIFNYGPSCFNNTNYCTIPFNITSDFKGLVRIYSFKQVDMNKILMSERTVNFHQFTGTILNENQAEGCYPYITNSDMNVTVSKNGIPLDPNAIANPCGTLAKFFPNDEYVILDNNSNQIAQKHINFDYNKRLINYPADSNNTQWIDIKQSYFLTWITFNDNYIEYSTIYGGIAAGSYNLVIKKNNQPYKDQDKKVIIGLHWWFGRLTIYCCIFLIVTLIVCIGSMIYLIRYNINSDRKNKQFIIQN